MYVLTPDELHELLKSAVPEPKLTIETIAQILYQYRDGNLPSKQSTADMNKALSKIGVQGKGNRGIRGELCICFIHMKMWNRQDVQLGVDELCKRYDLQHADVEKDPYFRSYCYYLCPVLDIVEPGKHREFIIQDVLVPLSGARGIKYITGSGKEASRTMIRYKAFEIESHWFRPKTLTMIDGIERRPSSRPCGGGVIKKRSMQFFSNPLEKIKLNCTEQGLPLASGLLRIDNNDYTTTYTSTTNTYTESSNTTTAMTMNNTSNITNTKSASNKKNANNNPFVVWDNVLEIQKGRRRNYCYPRQKKSKLQTDTQPVLNSQNPGLFPSPLFMNSQNPGLYPTYIDNNSNYNTTATTVTTPMYGIPHQDILTSTSINTTTAPNNTTTYKEEEFKRSLYYTNNYEYKNEHQPQYVQNQHQHQPQYVQNQKYVSDPQYVHYITPEFTQDPIPYKEQYHPRYIPEVKSTHASTPLPPPPHTYLSQSQSQPQTSVPPRAGLFASYADALYDAQLFRHQQLPYSNSQINSNKYPPRYIEEDGFIAFPQHGESIYPTGRYAPPEALCMGGAAWKQRNEVTTTATTTASTESVDRTMNYRPTDHVVQALPSTATTMPVEHENDELLQACADALVKIGYNVHKPRVPVG